MAEPVLQASWVVEEADLHAATRALPGSTLGLLRWPIAFFVAYVGVGLADPRVGAPFALGSAAVIAVAWIVVSLARRGTVLRRAARAPQEQRQVRLAIDDARVRLETASGHAGEFPLADLTHARTSAAGLLLNVGGQAIFVPRRALEPEAAAWRALVAQVPARRWPDRLAVTVGVWALAAGVAIYAFLK
jgi:hypothetical protein